MLWRKYRVGRSWFSTLHVSNLGRRLITLFKSEPLTHASRRRKVKIGRSEEGLEVRISGHMEKIRRNSSAVKFMEVRNSTVDFRSSKQVVMIGGWCSIKEKKSRPLESRKKEQRNYLKPNTYAVEFEEEDVPRMRVVGEGDPSEGIRELGLGGESHGVRGDEGAVGGGSSGPSHLSLSL
ncbi:receptor-like protein kinase [Corchorus olitorius]|uniref:Receptor-like protein kinase n=1 Tax=Corchorus olitorius TaxID=93759 RepID=A0A1R3G311_9ROSI|nr:receptor-like protein kinase [Corchorus olitorius]